MGEGRESSYPMHFTVSKSDLYFMRYGQKRVFDLLSDLGVDLSPYALKIGPGFEEYLVNM